MKVCRKPSDDLLYARELGISKRLVILLGGAVKLRAMASEVRACLLGSQGSRKACMRDIGMQSRVPGRMRDVA
jgi:hypothetical protein